MYVTFATLLWLLLNSLSIYISGNELIAYPQEDLSSWLVDSPSASSDLNDDIDSTIDTASLDTPDCNFDKDLDFPSSTGKRKSKRPMRIISS